MKEEDEMKKTVKLTIKNYNTITNEYNKVNEKLNHIAKIFDEITEITENNKWMHYTGASFSENLTEDQRIHLYEMIEKIACYDPMRLVNQRIASR